MALLTAQDISPAGHQPTYAGVNATDTVVIGTGQRVFIHVKNNSGGSVSVTVTAVKTSAIVSGVGGVTIGNRVVAIPGGEERMIGPFTEAFTDTDGTVTIRYSATASVIAGVFQLPAQY